MKLSLQSIKNEKDFWQKAGISLPEFNIEKMKTATKENPKWVHFGAGNIFRAFPAAMMQDLLDKGIEKTGIIVAEGYDGEIIDKSFTDFDNLTILVTLKSDGTTEKKVIASMPFAYRMDKDMDMESLKEIFSNPSLQMASFTITEKGYNVQQSDIDSGHENPKTYLGRVASLLYHRYKNSNHPIAMVSMDNCSHNGDILFSAMETIAKGWIKNGTAESGFLDYIQDKNKVGFPWSMIDKITPRPDDSVRNMLTSCGLENMDGTVTSKNTFVAPFVNAEETQYLVIEDVFPNGRPHLEKAGVLFTDKETVDRVEKMKVCTCLNPLHTALAVFGCLLGYTRISEEMKDPDLVKLIKGIGYDEGLPVVTDPLILSPKQFIDTVINVRLPNPFMPDSPQRIAMDTSLKIPIRFGETIKEREKRKKKNEKLEELKFIPLVFAGWLRYLLGIDDNGNPFEVSPDPNYETLKNALFGIEIGKNLDNTETIITKIKPILSNSAYFGVDLYKIGLGNMVEDLFLRLIEGAGAVRKVLQNS